MTLRDQLLHYHHCFFSFYSSSIRFCLVSIILSPFYLYLYYLLQLNHSHLTLLHQTHFQYKHENYPLFKLYLLHFLSLSCMFFFLRLKNLFLFQCQMRLLFLFLNRYCYIIICVWIHRWLTQLFLRSTKCVVFILFLNPFFISYIK